MSEDPYVQIDAIYSKLEALEDYIAYIFKDDAKHRGIHLRVQETLEDLYEALRTLRLTLYEKKC